MSKPIVVAHISDVHLAPLPRLRLQDWNLKRLLGFLNWQRGRKSLHRRDVLDRLVADLVGMAPDHIAVTGDLANLGLPLEHVAGLRWLESLGEPRDVSVIPGNHDIYCPLRGDPGVGRWAAYMAGDGLEDAGVTSFPYVRVRDGIALVGVNSAVPTPPGRATGVVDEVQLAGLGKMLDELFAQNLIRVVMIHHPPLQGQAPPSRALENAGAFEATLVAHGAELVLHGHNHCNMLSWVPSEQSLGPVPGGGAFPVVGVASGSAGLKHGDQSLARYNLFHIDRDDAGPRIEMIGRGIESLDGPVVELERRLLVPKR